ncbi:MAG: hypothetical protein KDE20_30015, partial [Caldilineaceae bacterium]|nr:hypothetical protein [Caldilineaceae bacterium]
NGVPVTGPNSDYDPFRAESGVPAVGAGNSYNLTITVGAAAVTEDLGFESNDTINSAIPTGLSTAAPGVYSDSGTLSSTNTGTLDVDMLSFQLDEGDFARVNVSTAIYTRVFDTSGKELASGRGSLLFRAPTTGRFVVGLSGYLQTYGNGVPVTGPNSDYDPFRAESGVPAVGA